MADDKNKVTDKAGEIAKNIWLAGVGAYGRAVDEAQGRLEKAGVEPPKLFRELVKAGAALEEEARDAIEAGQAARSSVEERINRVRENFNLQRPVRGEDLLALHAKIDRLADQLEALVEALGASSTSSVRKAPVRKKKAAPATRSAAKGGTGGKTKAATGTRAKTPARTAKAAAPSRRKATAKRSTGSAAPAKKKAARKKTTSRSNR